MCSREHPPFSTGGEGVFSGYVERLFPKYGIDLTIIASDPRTLRIYKETKNNIVIYRVPVFGPVFLTKFPSFAYFARRLVTKLEKDFDLIYAFSSSFSLARYRTSRPFIVHFHITRYGEYRGCKLSGRDLYAFLNRLYVPFDRNLLRKADGIIAPSENMIEEFKNIVDTPGQIEIIPNGVDAGLFRPLSSRTFDSREKNILYAGRLDARKGIDTLFYAFSEIIKTIKAKLTIVGDGIEKSSLMRLARRLNISVDFMGRIPHRNLPEVYNKADLVIVPSIYEPFGMVALESMACAAPTIVSTACPDFGIPRFEKGDLKGLIKVMIDSLSSEDRLKELSAKSLMISKEYKWERVIFKLVEYLKKFI